MNMRMHSITKTLDSGRLPLKIKPAPSCFLPFRLKTLRRIEPLRGTSKPLLKKRLTGMSGFTAHNTSADKVKTMSGIA